MLKQTRTPDDGHNYSKNISKQNITLLKLKRADYVCKPNMLKRENFMKNLNETEPQQNVQVDTLNMIYQTILCKKKKIQ